MNGFAWAPQVAIPNVARDVGQWAAITARPLMGSSFDDRR